MINFKSRTRPTPIISPHR